MDNDEIGYGKDKYWNTSLFDDFSLVTNQYP
jgi:hypothetical protein